MTQSNYGDAGLSVMERERRCVELANSIMLQRIDTKSLGSCMYETIVVPFKDPLAWILLPLVLLLLPFSAYEAFVAYRQNRAKWEELLNRARNHVAPCHDMAVLWNHFGLRAIDFLKEEDILAQCLSDWMTILYEGSYSLSAKEIVQLFNEESKRQGKAMNDGYAQGLKLNLANWRIGAVRNIVENAPPY